MGEGELREIATRLHGASIGLLRMLRREDDESGLSAPRLSALSVIVFAGPLSLNALAEAEQVRPPTMSRLVDALVEAGLVTRETRSDDRRAVSIAATQKGVRLMEAGRASGRSILLTTTIGFRPSASALPVTNLVCGIGPSAESTSRMTPSTIDRMRSTSAPKSAWPGVSTMLIWVVSPSCSHSTEVHLARMVIPRSFSRSFESIALSSTR